MYFPVVTLPQSLPWPQGDLSLLLMMRLGPVPGEKAHKNVGPPRIIPQGVSRSLTSPHSASSNSLNLLFKCFCKFMAPAASSPCR